MEHGLSTSTTGTAKLWSLYPFVNLSLLLDRSVFPAVDIIKTLKAWCNLLVKRRPKFGQERYQRVGRSCL